MFNLIKKNETGKKSGKERDEVKIRDPGYKVWLPGAIGRDFIP